MRTQAPSPDPNDMTEEDMQMEFSPPKPLSMMAVFHNIEDETKSVAVPDQTQPSPTFSQFAPKNLRNKRDDIKAASPLNDQTQPSPTFSHFAPKSSKNRGGDLETPLSRTLKQVDTRRTPFTGNTPVPALVCVCMCPLCFVNANLR
jgi:hypothetical protein